MVVEVEDACDSARAHALALAHGRRRSVPGLPRQRQWAPTRQRRSTLEEDVAALLWRTTQFEVQLEELDLRKMRLREWEKSQRLAAQAQQAKLHAELDCEEPTWTRIMVTRHAICLTALIAIFVVLLLGRFVLSL